MDQILTWVLVLILFLSGSINSEEEDVNQSLVQFFEKLSAGNVQDGWGWNMNSDPCADKWIGIKCDSKSRFVRKIVLEEMNLSGILDADSLCRTTSLVHLSLKGNNITSSVPKELGNCKGLTHLYLNRNHFSGSLPDSLSLLSNLKRLEIADNKFSGELPADLLRISGLITLFAENNELSGRIPNFDFSDLVQFNVSNNNLSGPIPDVKGRLTADSFAGNPGLCGPPLPIECPPSASTPKDKPKSSSLDRFLIYIGYIILVAIVVVFLVFKLVGKKKSKVANFEGVQRGRVVDNKSSSPFIELKNGGSKSEYSISSVENRTGSSSLVVLTSPISNVLKFEDLLRAPAELMGRGKHGSLYKVMLENGRKTLAVKRIKEWSISSEDFKRRMRRLDQVRHPNVLPPVAFYCSNQEKLLVYEYQKNGSLFRILHGSKNGLVFDWGSRLNIAASIAEALAFTHQELCKEGIPHGNLKSTNILFDDNMDPIISEYGLMIAENQGQQSSVSASLTYENNDSSDDHQGQVYRDFKGDVCGFGLILLELLTGKLVKNNGLNLGSWVKSVIEEEWTGEVFDEALSSGGASEERMVRLLQVALKCINPNFGERPDLKQVAGVINSIKEEEEISISSEQ